MCGRFAQHTPFPLLKKIFQIDLEKCDQQPNYNIAPSQEVLTVIHHKGTRQLHKLNWGLVPSWIKDLSKASKLINARVETLKEKPSFRNAFKKRRCLILADGFYEWKKEGSSKQPFYLTLLSGDPIAFAGLWETWKKEEGQRYNSCAIITTEASESVSEIHNRMPVILKPEAVNDWLNPQLQNTDTLDNILRDGHVKELRSYPVSKTVNNVMTNDERCIEMLGMQRGSDPDNLM